MSPDVAVAVAQAKQQPFAVGIGKTQCERPLVERHSVVFEAQQVMGPCRLIVRLRIIRTLRRQFDQQQPRLGGAPRLAQRDSARQPIMSCIGRLADSHGELFPGVRPLHAAHFPRFQIGQRGHVMMHAAGNQ